MNIIFISTSWELGLKRKMIRMALKDQMDGYVNTVSVANGEC